MTGFRLRRIFGGEDAQAYLVIDHSVIARQQGGAPVADQIAARIAHVRHGCTIVAQSTGHDSGGHGHATRTGGAAGFVDLDIGGLHQALQQRGATWPALKPISELVELSANIADLFGGPRM